MSEQALERRDYKAGQLIFSQGDDGDEAFIVDSGQIEIAGGKKNAQMIIATIETGGIFGEMALIEDLPRMATARATKPSSCIVVPKVAFTRLMKDANPVLQILLSTMMQRLRSNAKKSVGATVG